MKIKQDIVHLELETNKYKLIRERDKLTKQSQGILFLEFNEDKTFKSKHEEIKVGRSLLMSPFNKHFTWLTTSITEIIEQKEDYYHFKTENSEYKLIKL